MLFCMHIIYTGTTPFPTARVQRVDRVGALEDNLKKVSVPSISGV
jgi:hypothetical protein